MAGQNLLVLCEEADCLLYALTDTGRLVATELPKEVAHRRTVCLYRDTNRTFPPRKRRRRPVGSASTAVNIAGQDMVDITNNDDDIYGEPSTSTSMSMPQPVLDDSMHLTNGRATSRDHDEPGDAPTWFCTCSDREGMSIYTLPEWEPVFQCPEILTMPPILEHGRQRAGEDEEEAEYPEDVTIEQVLITDVGHSRSGPT